MMVIIIEEDLDLCVTGFTIHHKQPLLLVVRSLMMGGDDRYQSL
jgi:hypothetical protein